MKFPTLLYKLKEGVIWVGCDKLSIFNKEKILFLLKKLNSSSKIMRWDFKNSTLFQISILVHLQILLPIKATKETTINSLGLLTIVLFVVVEEKEAKTNLSINYVAKMVIFNRNVIIGSTLALQDHKNNHHMKILLHHKALIYKTMLKLTLSC